MPEGAFCIYTVQPTTRWSTTFSLKVDLHHAVDCKTMCVAILVMYPADLRWNETLALHRVVRCGGGQRR